MKVSTEQLGLTIEQAERKLAQAVLRARVKREELSRADAEVEKITKTLVGLQLNG